MRFEEVAAQVRDPILRYSRRFVGDAALAEDLLQETLVRISKGLDGFEARASVKTWAFKIATHVAIDHLRQSQRGPALVEVEDLAVVPDPGEGLGERLVIDEMNACLRGEIEPASRELPRRDSPARPGGAQCVGDGRDRRLLDRHRQGPHPPGAGPAQASVARRLQLLPRPGAGAPLRP